jgi:hypothetical protein
MLAYQTNNSELMDKLIIHILFNNELIINSKLFLVGCILFLFNILEKYDI